MTTTEKGVRTDEYGTSYDRITDRTVQTVAMVQRTHGAYLISYLGDLTQELPDNELYDAASSLRKAKQIARRDAASIGYVGPWRWRQESYGWSLDAVCVDEREIADVEDEIR